MKASPMSFPRRRPLLAALFGTLLLSACAEPVKREASYPTRPRGTDEIVYSDKKRETIWGEGESIGSKLFGREEGAESAGASGIGVNSYLWRATLDTVSFMPIASADPFGGVVLTDWYENPDTQGQRFKVNVYILDRQLRADGVRVAVFKQEKQGANWRDAKVPEGMATDIENTVLTRARELRVAASGQP